MSYKCITITTPVNPESRTSLAVLGKEGQTYSKVKLNRNRKPGNNNHKASAVLQLSLASSESATSFKNSETHKKPFKSPLTNNLLSIYHDKEGNYYIQQQ